MQFPNVECQNHLGLWYTYNLALSCSKKPGLRCSLLAPQVILLIPQYENHSSSGLNKYLGNSQFAREVQVSYSSVPLKLSCAFKSPGYLIKIHFLFHSVGLG